MTHNQIEYAKLKEDTRHNLASEGETNRSNVVREQETNRHNLVTEAQGQQTINETGRHNVATETETNRHNIVSEGQEAQKIAETKRHNLASEAINSVSAGAQLMQAQTGALNLAEASRHNVEAEAEAYRHNTASEQIQSTGNLLNYDAKSRQPSSKTALDEAQASAAGVKSGTDIANTISGIGSDLLKIGVMLFK